MLILYVVVLGLSALALLAMAVTRFGTNSVVDRIIHGVLGAGAAAYVIWLAFFVRNGPILVFQAAYLLPIFASFRLVQGFRRRKQDAAERADYRDGVRAADAWRAQRRW
jgi:hypothetical protein